MRTLATIVGIAAIAGSASAQGARVSGIIVLNPSADGALSMNGNASIHVPARAVYVNSASPRAIDTVGNCTLDVPELFVVGGTRFNGRSECTGAVTIGGAPFQDPWQHMIFPHHEALPVRPSPEASGPITMQPGYYPSEVVFTSNNADVTLAPGVYVFGNGFRMTGGSLTGSGVHLVNLNGSFDLRGNAGVTLTPSLEGFLANVVISQPASNTSTLHLRGGSTMRIFGGIYVPGALVNLVGTSSIAGSGPQMGDLLVCDRLSLSGTATITIGHDAMRAVRPPRMPLFD
ncbi:MAG: hypothetical protein KF866_07085 [Phycisphaeraceae bacterium]|nr:hypothetical protein [Phycisphaeraceae bacterium]